MIQTISNYNREEQVMGRSSSGGSRGGGSHRSSHGGGSHRSSHGHSVSHSSTRRSSYSSRPRSYGYSTPRPPRRRTYYSNSPASAGSGCASGCTTAMLMPFIMFLLVIFIFIALANSCSSSSGSKAVMTDDVVNDAAENYYTKQYGSREDIFLFYVAYSEVKDTEIQIIKYGDDAARIVGANYEYFFDLYDDYYQDDVGIQITCALEDFLAEYAASGSITPEKSFDKNMIKDDLGWIDSKSTLQKAAKEFYNETGIQFSVVVTKYDDLSGAKTKNNSYKVVIALIIVAGVIVIVNIIIKWRKKKKELRIQELEEQKKILETPLETFGGVSGLAKKYDEMDKNGSGGSNNSNNSGGSNDLPDAPASTSKYDDLEK